jgi:DNA-binding transcriptional LysR family regulator
MDWRSINFDWNRARAFLVTAEEGSLSAAARALNMAQPTVGRQVTALEQELDVVLFERVGRGLTLTPSGRELLDHVRSMGDAAGRVSLSAGGQSHSIAGSICITASEIYSAHLLPPVIAKLRRLAPSIDIDIVASNASVDLRKREADIAIRNAMPTQPDLIARKLGDDLAQFYATPAYLHSIGNPKTLTDLGNADFIGFDNSDVMIKGLHAIGLDVGPANFPVRTANHLVHWELVKQGVGVGVVPISVGSNEPRVQQVFADMTPIDFPIWLTTHRELNTSRRVRLVFDLLAQELAR